MAKRDPLEEFLERVGQEVSDTLVDLGDGLLVAGIAALTGMGVAKAAPAVKKAARTLLEPPVLPFPPAPPSPPASRSRQPKPRQKALPQARKRARTAPEPEGEVIDLVPGSDGVYRYR